MSANTEIQLEDDILDASHGPTRLLLLAEYWKGQAKAARTALEAANTRIEDLTTAANRCINDALAMGHQVAHRAGSGEAKPFAWYRLVNGHRAGISFEQVKPDLPGWEEKPLYTTTPAAVQPDDRDARIRGLEVALAQALEIPEPDSGRDAALKIAINACCRVESSAYRHNNHERASGAKFCADAIREAMAAQQGEQVPAAKDQT